MGEPLEPGDVVYRGSTEAPIRHTSAGHSTGIHFCLTEAGARFWTSHRALDLRSKVVVYRVEPIEWPVYSSSFKKDNIATIARTYEPLWCQAARIVERLPR